MTLGPRTSDAATRERLEAVKIVALSHGVRMAPHLLADLGGRRAVTIHEYATTGGITLELPEGVLVNAPFDAHWCADSELDLRREDGDLVLALGDSRIPVLRVVPLPGYLETRDDLGELVSETAMSHADRIRVSPIVGCAYNCQFCDLARVRYRPRPIEQILRAIDIALVDDALPPRHLLISGGSPPIKHVKGQDYFSDVCIAIARHLRGWVTAEGTPFEVDIMMSARPDGPEFVDRVVDAGVTGFSLNLEVFSESGARRQLPLKHKWSRKHLEPMIVRAVKLLGSGEARVRSLILPGLESTEETLAGVEWLASLGASPVLSPFRPAPGTALEDANPVSPAALREVLDESRSIVARYGVMLGPRCVDCQHNTLSLPWDVKKRAA